MDRGTEEDVAIVDGGGEVEGDEETVLRSMELGTGR